jgi:hypothetical protein
MVHGIVLFESLRNCKRRNKGNFTLKSNSNNIMMCGELNNIFYVKDLERFTFYVKLIHDRIKAIRKYLITCFDTKSKCLRLDMERQI